ncbi:MAG: hypothetical protein QOI59_3162 [Gammaproteobacteria bacterium]|nr:hypothetical protein [Gammaproteobacteria bacterium]
MRPPCADLPTWVPERRAVSTRLSGTRGAAKRIDQRNTERLEIADIASNHRQPTNERRSRDEGVFEMVIRPPVHELRPTTEDGGVRRKNAITVRNAIEPILDLFGLRSVLAPSNLYAGLYLTHRHSGNVQRFIRCALKPSNHTLMRFDLAQLRNNIRIQ